MKLKVLLLIAQGFLRRKSVRNAIEENISELPLWEICIPRIVQAEEILIGCFVECQSIKKVGGRRSVEELYQALFFVSPVPPECFTERNENRA